MNLAVCIMIALCGYYYLNFNLFIISMISNGDAEIPLLVRVKELYKRYV